MGAGLLRSGVFILGLISGIQLTVAFTVDKEVSLKQQLLNKSGVGSVRPNQVTLVELSFNLLSINKVDLKNEVFGVSGWWSMKWNDSRLDWTNESFGVIPVIQVYNSDIWTPALVVDNSVDDLGAIDEDTIPIRIQKNGQVTWNPPGILETSCEMIVTYFPFDTQTCSIQVTSFGYTIQELNISVHSSGISRTYYQGNGEWDILKTWNTRSEFGEDNYDYAKVSYYLQIRRRATYYGLNTILPVLLNSMLIPLVFLLPHDAGEKIGYCLTVLLAYVVILTIVTNGLPTTDKSQSLLGVFIAMVLSLSAIAVFLAIHSLYIFHRSPERPIPDWQGRLTRSTFRILRLKCAAERSQSVSPADDEAGGKKRRLHRLNTKSSMSIGKRDGEVSTSNISTLVSDGNQEPMSWHLVAQAYDAFFLRFYFAVIICSSVSFLLAIASNQF